MNDDIYDLMPLGSALDTTVDDSNYSFHFQDPKPPASDTKEYILLNQSLAAATSIVTHIQPILSSPEHSTVLQMTHTALTRLSYHYILNHQELVEIEVPPKCGSRLRCAKELKPDRNMTQNLRWKRSSDIHVSPNGCLATWNSTINTYHWSSTKCHSRLHSGHYTIELELQQAVKDAAHIRVGFLLEYIASNGRRHVDWGQQGGVLGTSTTSWGIDVISSSKVMMELHLPRDACGTACFVTPEHGRSASIPLPLGAVVIPACSMERKNQSVYITNVTEHDNPLGENRGGRGRKARGAGGTGEGAGEGHGGGKGSIERRRTTSETSMSSSILSTLSSLSAIENKGNKIKNVVQRQVTRIWNALVRLQEYVGQNVAIDDDCKDPRKRRTLDHLITQLCTTIDPLKMTLHALYLSDKFGNEPDRHQQEEDRRTVRHGGGRDSGASGSNSDESHSKHNPKELNKQESADLRDIIGEEENIHYTEETLRVSSYQAYEDEEEDDVSVDDYDYANLFVCDGVGNVNLVDSIVSDEDGRQFWTKSFGATTYQVSWKDFIRHLHAWLSGTTDVGNTTTKSMLLTEDTLHNLKLTLDSCESGTTNIYRFSALLEGFGPTLSISVQKMSSTLKESWFHGFISFDEAKEVLRGCQAGTFLVRFSESKRCCFSIACVVQSSTGMKSLSSSSSFSSSSSSSAASSSPSSPSFSSNNNTQVQQIIIEATKNQGYRTSNGSIFYSSMAKVVDAFDILKYPAPNTISRCRFFHGFLTYKEAKHLLKDKIVGTYLMRFSKSQPGSLVLAYTCEKGSGNSNSSRSKQSKRSSRSSKTNSSSNIVVKQSLVYSSPQGYTIGGEKVWPTLDALIYDNRNRLKEPCFAVEYEIPPEIMEEQHRRQRQRQPNLRSTTKEIKPTSETQTVLQTHQPQQSRSSLQRAWSAPTVDIRTANDDDDDIYNKMFPISPSDARVQEQSFATGTAKIGDALHGGVVTEADMNNFIVSDNYGLASQPTSSVLPVPSASLSVHAGTGTSSTGSRGGGGSGKSSVSTGTSITGSMNSQAAARLAAGLPPMSPVPKESTLLHLHVDVDGPD